MAQNQVEYNHPMKRAKTREVVLTQMVKAGLKVARKVLLVLHQRVTWLVGVLMAALQALQVQLEEVQGEKKEVVHQGIPGKGLMKQKAAAGQMGQV